MGKARNPDNDACYVLNICDEILGIKASREYRFDWLLGDPSPKTGVRRRLPVDAFWQPLGLVVEVMESQHFEATPHFDKPSVLTVSGVHRGIQRRLYDERRAELVPAHGLTLVSIPIGAFEVRGKKIKRNPRHDISVVHGLLADAGVIDRPA